MSYSPLSKPIQNAQKKILYLDMQLCIILVEPYWKGRFPAKKGVAFIIYHYSKEKKPLEKFSIIFIGIDLFSRY